MASLESDIEAMKRDMTKSNPFYDEVHRKHNQQQSEQRKAIVQQQSNANGSVNANSSQQSLEPPSIAELAQQKKENLKKQETVKNELMRKKQKLEREQERLANVNSELEVIENELAKDVFRLREMIDSLSYDISYYERDHESKKKAYEESKKMMDGMKERRDNLTKHLHTIICTNEERKSQKLEQLMKALESPDSDADATVRASTTRPKSHSQPSSQMRAAQRPHVATTIETSSVVRPTMNSMSQPMQPRPQPQQQSQPTHNTVRMPAAAPQESTQTLPQAAPPSRMRNRNERDRDKVQEKEKPVYRFSGFPDEVLEMEDI